MVLQLLLYDQFIGGARLWKVLRITNFSWMPLPFMECIRKLRRHRWREEKFPRQTPELLPDPSLHADFYEWDQSVETIQWHLRTFMQSVFFELGREYNNILGDFVTQRITRFFFLSQNKEHIFPFNYVHCKTRKGAPNKYRTEQSVSNQHYYWGN